MKSLGDWGRTECGVDDLQKQLECDPDRQPKDQAVPLAPNPF